MIPRTATPQPSRKDETLFTAQQLFGEFGSPTDVLAHAPFLERARARRVHGDDAGARLALGAYMIARAVARLLAGDQENDPEAFLWQVDALRRHLRDLPAGAPEAAHLCGISEAIPIGSQSNAGLRLGLTAYAYFLEHEARLEEALEILALAARTHGPELPPSEATATALFAGRLNRLLARWDQANQCYTMAETAAAAVSDTVSMFRSRLGRSAVHRGQGNLPRARAMSEQVAADAGAAGLREVQAMAYADLGAVLDLQGKPVESVRAKYRAFLLTEDALQRMRVLGDLGIGLFEIGAYEGARLAFEIVVGSRTSFLVRTNALLELMDLESAVGNRVAFERRRAAAEEARDRMPPSMAADYFFKSGVGLARFGQTGRARDLLQSGMGLAETHQLNAWYFKFEQVLGNLESCQVREPESAAPAALSWSPVVQEVAVGLREYALQAT